MSEDLGVPLGERMMSYEWMPKLSEKCYGILRVDGRNFHSYLKGADKPFDYSFMSAMDLAAVMLCEEMAGAQIAYVQSDEISVLFTNVHRTTGEHWFGGEIPKITSIAASIATAAFNNGYVMTGRNAHFDARVLSVPDWVEAGNYFLWRQRDWRRNAIQMIAQSWFSHRQLLHRSTAEKRMMLEAIGIKVEERWRPYELLGRVVVRASAEREVTYVTQRDGKRHSGTAIRTWWDRRAAPEFVVESGSWLSDQIPREIGGE